jgi:phage terminase Nu1 subunit (DNA packaging protein)
VAKAKLPARKKPANRKSPGQPGQPPTGATISGQGATAPPPAERATGRLWTRHELAAEVGVHPQTVVKWERDGMPVAIRGARGVASKYRLADVWVWAMDRERGRAGGEAVNLATERAKLAEAQRLESELRLRKRQGELLERADVAKVWGEHIAQARTQLLSVPRAVADECTQVARVDGAVGVERVITKAIHGAIAGLAGREG